MNEMRRVETAEERMARTSREMGDKIFAHMKHFYDENSEPPPAKTQTAQEALNTISDAIIALNEHNFGGVV